MPFPMTPAYFFGVNFIGRGRWFYKEGDLPFVPQNIPVIGLRSLPPANIKVTAVCKIPGVKVLLLRITSPAQTCLTYIVKRGPYKVANHPWMIYYTHPVVESLKWQRFCGKHDPVWKTFMIRFIICSGIIITCHIECRKESVLIFLNTVYSTGDGS